MTAVPPEGAWLAGAGTPAEEQGAATPPCHQRRDSAPGWRLQGASDWQVLPLRVAALALSSRDNLAAAVSERPPRPWPPPSVLSGPAVSSLSHPWRKSQRCLSSLSPSFPFHL